jgi:hypothetical protein
MPADFAIKIQRLRRKSVPGRRLAGIVSKLVTDEVSANLPHARAAKQLHR